MTGFEQKDTLYQSFSSQLWKPTHKPSAGLAKKVFE
jgi:hypothetical protein